MNVEPQKFFIGLIDFFSIFLPGALLTYLLKDEAGTLLMGDGYDQLAGTEGALVFLFASYLLGHFIFLLGSQLDDLYDVIRRTTFYTDPVTTLAKGDQVPTPFVRWLARVYFKKEKNHAVKLAVEIRDHYLKPLNNPVKAINTFQWCKTRLTMEQPEAIATVHRFEADSKFFRSFIVVLAVVIPWGFASGQALIALIGLPALLMASLRYADQRLKATNQAYWYIITLESQREGGYRIPQESPVEKSLSHSGGVVFRERLLSNSVEYLLVTAKNSKQEWVLPKGHIEAKEDPTHTAVREVYEETGHWARILTKIDDITMGAGRAKTQARFFLMELVEEDQNPKPENRDQRWLPIKDAIKLATFDDTKNLLNKANTLYENMLNKK